MSQLNDENIATNLGRLGINFQIKLLCEILTPNNINLKTSNNFFDEVIQTLDSNYFEDKSLRLLMTIIKNYFNEFNLPPNIDNIYSLVNTTISNEIDRNELIARLQSIKNIGIGRKNGTINNDTQLIKNSTIDFIIQQEMLKAIKFSDEKLNKGIVDHGTLESISEKFKKIGQIGKIKHNSVNVLDELDNCLSETTRKGVKTGIDFIDETYKDARGLHNECCLIVASSGTGKTPLLSMISVNNYLAGKNWIHILMEGDRDQVRKKMVSQITGIPISQLAKQSELAKKRIEVIKNNPNVGTLKVIRMPYGTKPLEIKKEIIAESERLGQPIDGCSIDYLDCNIIDDDLKTGNQIVDEERIMRRYESIASELELSFFIGCQSGRQGANKPVLGAEDVAGSFGRVRVSALVITLGATQEQKNNDLVNVAIPKCRFARGGQIFENVIFDNDAMILKTNNMIFTQDDDLVKKTQASEEKYDLTTHPISNINLN